jgi:hypothetical protein
MPRTRVTNIDPEPFTQLRCSVTNEMHTMLRSSLLAVTTLLSGWSMAQSECADYHKFNCDRSSDVRFSLNGQSKSASVQIGVPTELNVIVYKGQDYRVSFCFDEKVIGDHIVARLIEKVREPRELTEQVIEKEEILDAEGKGTGQFKDVTRTKKSTTFEEVRKVIWDNQEHDMSNEVEFSATATKRLVVEVTAPGAVDAKPKNSNKAFDIGCVGILIEHMISPLIGFGGK